METPRQRFMGLLLSTERPGMMALVAYLDEQTDWYKAPASTKYHGAYEGGLVDHSLAVYDELERLCSAYEDTLDIPKDSRIIMALLHDLCKANTYKPVMKSRKTPSGTWEQYQGYERDEQYKFGGHGSKSVFLASRFIQLTDVEAAAINCHMGTWEQGKTYEINAVWNEYPAAWLLHAADESATFILKK